MDCDTGVDDALAIMLALNSPELDVRAITVCDGNVALDLCALNTARIAAFAVRELNPAADMPVIARGREITGKKTDAAFVHGTDGLGGVSHKIAFDGEIGMIEPDAAAVAEKFLVDAAGGGKITLVTTGPLTNLAHWTRVIPDALTGGIERVISMGGVFFEPGNVTPHAEFNIHSDARAAKTVLDFARNNGLHITFAGLDVTRRVAMTAQALSAIRAAHPENKSVPFIMEFNRPAMDFHKRKRGFEGEFLHDPLAAALAVDSSFCETIACDISIEADDSEYSGRTVCAESAGGAGPFSVCTEVDTERFQDFFYSRVTGIPPDEIKRITRSL